MVFLLLTELALKGVYWVVYGSYCLTHRAYYGRQKTREEILMDQIEEIQDQHTTHIKQLEGKLEELMINNYDPNTTEKTNE